MCRAGQLTCDFREIPSERDSWYTVPRQPLFCNHHSAVRLPLFKICIGKRCVPNRGIGCFKTRDTKNWEGVGGAQGSAD
jgi:hypothetical protein